MIKKLLLNTFAWSFFQLGGCLTWVVLRCIAFRTKRQYGKVKIRPGWSDHTAEEFADQVERALRLIDERDPRRGQRIQRHLRMIMDNPSIGYKATYTRGHRICTIDYDTVRATHVGSFPLEGRTQDRFSEELADLIIHEATHGRIEDRGIRYRKHNYLKIERICRRQEYFFRKRVCCGQIDLFGVPVDWEQATRFTGKNREHYSKLWTTSSWERLRDRFLVAFKAANRRECENRQLSSAAIQAGAADPSELSWSRYCDVNDMDEFRATTPALTAATLTHTAYGYMSVGMIRAAIRCFQRASQITTLRDIDQWSYAEALYLVDHDEASIQHWNAIEGDHFETSKSWQFAGQATCPPR